MLLTSEYIVHMLLSCLQKLLTVIFVKLKKILLNWIIIPACQVLQDFDDLYI